MRKILYGLFLTLLFISCKVTRVENFYTVLITEDAPIFLKADTLSKSIHFVNSGQPVFMDLDNSKKGYRKVKYKGQTGYVYRPSFTEYNKYYASKLNDSTKVDNVIKPNTSSPGGTISVKGYYRKDGTYVKPHTRKAPRRR